MQVGRLPDYQAGTEANRRKRAAKAARQIMAIEFTGDVFYAVTVPALKVVKFGYSNNVLRRFTHYQDSIPTTVELHAVLHAPKSVEAAIHKYFHPVRVHANEWYPTTDPGIEQFLTAILTDAAQAAFTRFAEQNPRPYPVSDARPLMRDLGFPIPEEVSRARRAFRATCPASPP